MSPLLDGAVVTNEVVYLHEGRITWMDNEPVAEPWDVLLFGYDPADDWDFNGGVAVGGVPFKEHLVLQDKPRTLREVQQAAGVARGPFCMGHRRRFALGVEVAIPSCDSDVILA